VREDEDEEERPPHVPEIPYLGTDHVSCALEFDAQVGV
jgi:hypothetical protein